MSEEKERIQSFLRSVMPGDMKEDVQYLGLTIKDIVITIIVTLLVLTLTLVLPVSAIIRLFIALSAFFLMLIFCYAKVSFRIKRRKLYIADKKEGTGNSVGDLLGVEEDGPFYRSGSRWHITYSILPPPWSLAVEQQIKLRVNSFGELLRYSTQKKITVTVFEERVPDYRHDYWQQKLEKTSPNEKVDKLKRQRLAHFQRRVESGIATKKEYYIALEIDETQLPNFKVNNRNRDSIIRDIREILTDIEQILQRSSHNPVLISGYTIPEIVGRHFAPYAWDKWKQDGGVWDDFNMYKIAYPSENRKELLKEARLQREGVIFKIIKVIKYKTNLFFSKNTQSQEAREHNNPDVVSADPILKDIALAFTSPAATGKSFIANHVAAAYSTAVDAVYVIDLSPDQASLTYLNPVFQTTREGWVFYMCRNMPAITVMVPEKEASFATLLAYLQERDVVKIIDISWEHKWRKGIEDYVKTVVIFDSDYHHFLQIQKHSEYKNYIAWWNKKDTDFRLEDLLKEFGLHARKSFPVYSNVAKNIWYGNPFILNDPSINHFIVKEGEIHD